ncbi:hypothetical protein CNEO4_120008 [Clostridium neonatale]|uniref:Uncharacterized protein n=1 Tax=Clostridium neonatale TaxID=137838 RepID=A0AA86JDB8_9CLOT|nr:hypothetical protein CNEO_40637 [Clostridium neonatale]CAG9710352.1 hypothetical protein CNEO_150010 [Clostridium neonatale]CAG9710849.1 hypothetical protein CNEO_40145 [Clostridium neonatale]CAI3194473.1 hypothetical protein CNEO2_130021 [Clostridium neonatale]CAI3197671.1 hypothetical protein CNEO2_230014 [Clostridium neonatale]
MYNWMHLTILSKMINDSLSLCIIIFKNIYIEFKQFAVL